MIKIGILVIILRPYNQSLMDQYHLSSTGLEHKFHNYVDYSCYYVWFLYGVLEAEAYNSVSRDLLEFRRVETFNRGFKNNLPPTQGWHTGNPTSNPV